MMKRAASGGAGGAGGARGGKQQKGAASGAGKGFTGRLTKGAGTHLASWLQEVDALAADEAQSLLDTHQPDGARSTPRGERAWAGLQSAHGKRMGHAKRITDVAYSGDILVTKDPASMRLWRARGDFALLRVVTAKGPHVAIHPCGQFIVTGTRGAANGAAADGGEEGKPAAKPAGGLKVWGPAGGSAFTAGKKAITRGVVKR